MPWPPGDRITEGLLNDDLGPDVDETVAERVTVPANPLLVSVTMAVPDEPRERLREVGLMEIEKSETTTVTETECTNEPLVPVTVTV